MGRISRRWRPSYQQMSPRTDILTCCPVSAVSSLLPPSIQGGRSPCNAQGRAHLASLQGSQCLAPLLAERVLKWASVSIFLLETQGLRVEPGLSHHPPQLLQEAARQMLGEPSSGMGPSWRPKGDHECPMASPMSLMIPALLSYPPANPAGRQCSPLQGEGAWSSTEPHRWLCTWSCWGFSR